MMFVKQVVDMVDWKKDDEILLGLATDDRIHWFKTIDNGTTYKANCEKNVKPVCPGKKTDLVCRDCRKAIIMWAEMPYGKFSS
jgi:hypothetical protein